MKIIYSSSLIIADQDAEISLLRKKIPILPTVYAENCKEPYGIKSYSFFMHKQSKRTPFAV